MVKHKVILILAPNKYLYNGYDCVWKVNVTFIKHNELFICKRKNKDFNDLGI